jgi:tetratricopeptide (TPR) repeat protein
MSYVVKESTGDINQYMPFAKQAYKHDTLRLRTLHALSLSYSRHRLFDSAHVYINKALRLDTANTKSWYYYGMIMKDKGEKERALSYFEKALKLDPYHARSMYEVGLIALEKGNMKKATKMLNRLKKREMANLPYIVNLEKKLDEYGEE